MNTFKTKSLYAALAGVGALGLTGAAEAVNVNPDGLGQVLIYPYYTVRTFNGNAYMSLLSVVNSTASAKGVKVRFLEGKNSVEVLDFNLYLSARDVWTVAITATSAGAGISTDDRSCTVPAVYGQGVIGFINAGLVTANDGAGTSLDRTREGYAEIIEMGDIVPGSVETAVTHVNGVPPCTASVIQNDSTVAAALTVGSGGLFGGISYVNVGAGTDYAVDAVALEAFRLTTPVYGTPGSIGPTLNDAAPNVATIYKGGTAATYSFTTPIDAVSGSIMHDTLMNEIVLDTGTASGTDWVITFPTKRYYVTTKTATRPFQNVFTSSGSCDDVLISLWDREERTGSTPISFSPPTGQTNTQLCWEANVLTFKSSALFGSTNQQNIDVNSVVAGYQNGWAKIDFTSSATGTVTAHRLPATTPVATFYGLPSIGFAIQSFNNNTRTNAAGALVNSSFGGNFNHKFTKQVF
jgi:hypothetical protein